MIHKLERERERDGGGGECVLCVLTAVGATMIPPASELRR